MPKKDSLKGFVGPIVSVHSTTNTFTSELVTTVTWQCTEWLLDKNTSSLVVKGHEGIRNTEFTGSSSTVNATLKGHCSRPTSDGGRTALFIGVATGWEAKGLVSAKVGDSTGTLMSEPGKSECFSHVQDLGAVYLIPKKWVLCGVGWSSVRRS